jgi:ribosomal protein L37AE/L43A
MTDDRAPCDCGKPTAPGKWRCDDCQTKVTAPPLLRLVVLPGVDADTLSRARHPSNVNAPDESNDGRNLVCVTTANDLRYGRRGGGWLPRGYSEHREDVHCPVCARLLTVGQDVHQECAPALDPPSLFPLG